MVKLKKIYNKWKQKVLFYAITCVMVFTTVSGALFLSTYSVFATNNILLGLPNAVYATGESHKYLVNDQYYPTVSFTAGGTTEWGFLQDFTINGEVVFCIEPLVKTHNGYDYVVGNINIKLNASQQDYMNKIAWYGYGYNGDTSDLNKYATEVLIWETCGVQVGNISDVLRDKVNQIRNLIMNSNNKPSFHNSVIELKGYGKENAMTIIDTKGIINSWGNNLLTSSGYHVEKNGNSVTVWADVGVKQNGSTSLIQGINKIVQPNGQAPKRMLCYISPSNAQAIVRLGDPHRNDSNFTLKIARGSLELTKINEIGELLDGAVFNLKSITPGINYNQDIVVKDGRIKVDDLIVGDYMLTEVTAPDHHVIMTSYQVTIKPNETTERIVVNRIKPTGKLVINKSFEEVSDIKDVDLSNVKFEVIAKRDVYDLITLQKVYSAGEIVSTLSLDETGQSILEDVPMGEYVVKEVSTLPEYVLDTREYDVVFRQEDYVTKEYTHTLNLENKLLLTDIQVKKVDAQTKRTIVSKDFQFGLYSDEACTNLISTMNADRKTGTATFKDIRFGTYYIKEISAPRGYMLSDEVIKVVVDENLENVGKVYTIEYQNTMMPIIVNTGDNTIDSSVFMILATFTFIVILLIKKRSFQKKDDAKKEIDTDESDYYKKE